MAIICAVGDGLQTGAAAGGRGCSTPIDDVPMRMLSQAASRRNITFVIREADLPLALDALHDAVLRRDAATAAGRGRGE